MKPMQISPCLVLCSLLLHAAAALADNIEIIDQPLPNGDFSAGLAEWLVQSSPDPATPAGTVQVINGAARLSKGAAYVTTLSQGFSAPEGLIALRLRLAELPQFSAGGSFIPEAFDVHISGSDGFARVASIRPGATASANAAALPAGFNVAPGVTLNGTALRIPLAWVQPGEALTVAFSLLGASADTLATVAIDDVVLEIEQKAAPPDPPGPDRVDDCELFRDGFEDEPSRGSIPRCPIGQVGDTGITDCAGTGGPDCPVTDFPGQDAEHGRDLAALAGILQKLGGGEAGFDYTKLDANGEPLPQSATAWSCVLDNFSGLVWEVKLDAVQDPRHHQHSYSWFQPDAVLDGGAPGVIDGGSCQGSTCDIQGLVETVNSTGLCGSTQWRVPTRAELLTLINAGVSNPALSAAFFPLGAGSYWSITPMAADSSQAWAVDYVDGQLQAVDKSTGLRVRLVREVR